MTTSRNAAWVERSKRKWVQALKDNLRERLPAPELMVALLTLFKPSSYPDEVEELDAYGKNALERVIQHFCSSDSQTVKVYLGRDDSVMEKTVKLFDAEALRRDFSSLKTFVFDRKGKMKREEKLIHVCAVPVENESDSDSDEQLFEFTRGKKGKRRQKQMVTVAYQAGDIIRDWLSSEAFVFTHPNITGIAQIYSILTVHSADCERGVSALKRIQTAFRNRLKQDTLEMLMYIKLNGPAPREFNFDHAVKLWLHKTRRNIDASRAVTSAQRVEANRLLSFQWGVSRIPPALLTEQEQLAELSEEEVMSEDEPEEDEESVSLSLSDEQDEDEAELEQEEKQKNTAIAFEDRYFGSGTRPVGAKKRPAGKLAHGLEKKSRQVQNAETVAKMVQLEEDEQNEPEAAADGLHDVSDRVGRIRKTPRAGDGTPLGWQTKPT